MARDNQRPQANPDGPDLLLNEPPELMLADHIPTPGATLSALHDAIISLPPR
jgi:hypothetical protein